MALEQCNPAIAPPPVKQPWIKVYGWKNRLSPQVSMMASPNGVVVVVFIDTKRSRLTYESYSTYKHIYV